MSALTAADLGSLGAALRKLADLLRGLFGGVSDEVSFLPPGAAPLVMIFGGLFVLGLSLMLALLQPTPSPARPRATAAAPSWPARATPAPRVVATASIVAVPAGATREFEEGFEAGRGLGPSDLDGILDAAEAAGLGEAHVVSVDLHRQRVRLGRCRSCRHRAGAARACDYERGFLLGALRAGNPRATVEEVACGADGACEFVLGRGG